MAASPRLHPRRTKIGGDLFRAFTSSRMAFDRGLPLAFELADGGFTLLILVQCDEL